MWVGGVDIPQELVDAHRAGRLVLFVGAGASRDAPSNLPDFARLTEAIAQEACYELKRSDLDHPDVLLGRIEDQGVDVHVRVAAHLQPPHSSCNRLHKAIVDLAVTSACPRIVTTNFDRHLSGALDGHKVVLDEYIGPALPIGDSFSGIVYLHGSLGRPVDRLVVTDGDFGRAYLRDAWAARFLERMFSTFTVLFVGYSHGDVVMRYLARALGPDGRRYVLTSSPNDGQWRDLGLRPIGYEIIEGSHAALGDALCRWAEVARMGLLDHRRRVAELVTAPPFGVPEDSSYLEGLISDPERVSLFTEHASGSDWLDWASTQPEFKNLLSGGQRDPEIARVLSRWFVERFVTDEHHTEHALALVAGSGGYLSPEVCQEFAARLHRLKSPRPSWLGAWLVLLLRHASSAEAHWLDYALNASKWPDDRAQLVLLFDRLTEPTAGLTHSYGAGGPRLEIRLRGSVYWLDEAWNQLLRQNLPALAPALAAVADRHLRRAFDLQVSAHPANSGWDPASFSRSAIEPHLQDQYREPIDVLIDAARDCVEELLRQSHPIAIGYLRSWAEAESRILRRLAIHGWTERRDVDASAKLEWLVDTGWLFDQQVRHEAFRLIAVALPDASAKSIQSLVDVALRVKHDESEYQPYERFNALVWMKRSRPDDPVISAALAVAHAADPGWQARTRPDFTHYIEGGGSVPSRPPMTAEEFHAQAQRDPLALIATLRTTKGAKVWDGQPTWADAAALITAAVQEFPQDGRLLLTADSIDVDIVRAVLDGWNRAELDTDGANAVLANIGTLDTTPIAADLAEMLSRGGRDDQHPTDWSALPAARRIAMEAWK